MEDSLTRIALPNEVESGPFLEVELSMFWTAEITTAINPREQCDQACILVQVNLWPKLVPPAESTIARDRARFKSVTWMANAYRFRLATGISFLDVLREV